MSESTKLGEKSLARRTSVRLGSLATQDVLVCRRCSILLLKGLMKPQRALLLFGSLGLYCPVCESLLLDLELESEK